MGKLAIDECLHASWRDVALARIKTTFAGWSRAPSSRAARSQRAAHQRPITSGPATTRAAVVEPVTDSAGSTPSGPTADGAVLAPVRRIEQADAELWLAQNPTEEGASVITSLPDISELPDKKLAEYTEWFQARVVQILRWLPTAGVGIFYQSDVKLGGVWLDKSYLVLRAAEVAGAHLLWRKVVCRKPAGSESLGRPGFSHMLAVSRTVPATTRVLGADVLPSAGEMSWSRAMGNAACHAACRYLQAQSATRTIVDPFCGRGSVLAIAEQYGFASIGVDISAKRCKAARRIGLTQHAHPSAPKRTPDGHA